VSIFRIERGAGALPRTRCLTPRALDSLPLLTCPATSAARLKLTLFDNMDTSPRPHRHRIGNSHRSVRRRRRLGQRGDPGEALWQLSEFSIVTAPVVVTGIHFRSRDTEGVAATHPDDPSGAMADPTWPGSSSRLVHR